MRRSNINNCSNNNINPVLLVVILLGIASTANCLQNGFGSRRNFVATMVTTAGTSTLLSPPPSIAEIASAPNDRSEPKEGGSMAMSSSSSSSSSSSKLLSIIPIMDTGAPATNATIPKQVSSQIEDLVCSLEAAPSNSIKKNSGSAQQQSNNAQSPLLSGSWRLLYSNAPEIVGLARGLPLGFRLGPTYQPLDTARGFFENTARLDHPYELATLQTIVIGTIASSKKGSVNAAGVVNDRNNRVDVRFEVIAFQLDTVLGTKLGTPIRKTLVPKAAAISKEGETVALPANDQTYLDETMRIVRGGDGSLFVFSRASATTTETSTAAAFYAPLTAKERVDILGSSSSTTLVGEDLEREKGETNKDIPAEIKYLFRERKR